MKRALTLIALLLCPALPAVAADSPGVVLVSWDGADRAVLEELLEAGRLPHLKRLIASSSLRPIEVKGHPTETKPGHAEMLTGLTPYETGVVSNDDFGPIPPGYTIFERAEAHSGGAVRSVFIASKSDNLGGRGYDEMVRESPDRARRNRWSTRGEPYFKTKEALDVFDAVSRSADETGPVALRALDEAASGPFLVFVHFADPDRAGHRYGRGSGQYREGFEACDRWLGRLLERLERHGLADSALVYVTTDHGFDPAEPSHERAPDGWLATNDKAVARGGILADIPATILARLGIDPSALQPRLIGAPLDAVSGAE